MSALTRIAAGIHRSVQVEKGDLVIISASPIPGNEKCISNVINDLFKRGAEVIYNSLEEIHVSGHACQEELKLIHSLVKPKYFMPVHGEYRHLMQHGLLAEKLGMDNTIVAGPDIITRGFVYVRESENIINDARGIVLKEVEKKLAAKDMSRRNIKFAVKNSLSQFIYMKIKRRPIIMPIIMEV